jgi:hypothetical protein
MNKYPPGLENLLQGGVTTNYDETDLITFVILAEN